MAGMNVSNVTGINTDNLNVAGVGKQIGATNGAGGKAGGFLPPHTEKGDIYEINVLRQELRDMILDGVAERNVQEIIDSGIEPDFLRAELSFFSSQNDNAGISIVLSFLAGNFGEAVAKCSAYADSNPDSVDSLLFVFISNYITGRFEQAAAQGEALNSLLNFSPLFCYAYADILLSLGYVDPSRDYIVRYNKLAKKYLPDFVSYKDKYEDEKRRRETGEQRMKKRDGSFVRTDRMDMMKNLLEQRGRILEVLNKKDISRDKWPLLCELDDIETMIKNFSRMNGQK